VDAKKMAIPLLTGIAKNLYKPERRTNDPMRPVQAARDPDIGWVLIS
jgi:hypothetical protein